MQSRNQSLLLTALVGFCGCSTTLFSQSEPYVVQLRTDSPLGTVKDTVGNNLGFGLSLGYVVINNLGPSTHGDGVLRLDYDQFSGRAGSSVKSFAAAFQVDLYPFKNSNFFFVFAPMIQSHRVSTSAQGSATYSSFGGQGGIGLSFENNYLHSIEISFEKMDRVELQEFSKVRLDFCFRF